MKNNVCPFCEEEKNRTCSLIGKDRTVFETSNFRVFPTVGGFVENYQLIVPKRHINCFGELAIEEWQEVKRIIEWERDINRKYFNCDSSIFEHGALLPSNESGKSIIHAHLHIFPSKYSLINNIRDYGFQIQEIIDITKLVEICHQYESYLYYSDVDGKDYIITHQGLPSQFLRKVLADSLGIVNWNWREYPCLEDMEKNLKFYKENPDVYKNFEGGK